MLDVDFDHYKTMENKMENEKKDVEKTIGEEMTPLAAEQPETENVESEEKEDTSLAEQQEESEQTEDSDEQSDDEESDELDDSEEDDDIDDSEDRKDAVQRRIDKLVAENKFLKEEMKSRKDEPKKDDDLPEYTKPQLKKALASAIEEGNYDVVMDIFEYTAKKERREAVKELQQKEQERAKIVQQQQEEWVSLVKENREFTSNDATELFPGSKKALDLNNPNSELRREAYRLYCNPSYQVAGGQRLAVADAFRNILKRKTLKGSNKQVKILNKKLSREKRKHSLSGGQAVKKDVQFRPKSDEDALADYIAERKNPFFANK